MFSNLATFENRFFRYPHLPLKAGYSAHSLSPHCRFKSRECEKQKSFCPPDWVSTIIGTEIVCRYNAPKNLNFQHTPQFGQPKHAPETSQLCPLMPLNSSSKQIKVTRILRLRYYFTPHKHKKSNTHLFLQLIFQIIPK